MGRKPKEMDKTTKRMRLVNIRVALLTIRGARILMLSLNRESDGSLIVENRPFPSCCEPHYESEAKGKAFHMQIHTLFAFE